MVGAGGATAADIVGGVGDMSDMQVISIDPQGRYVFLIEEQLPEAEVARITERIDEWWKSDRAFMVAAGRNIKLQRLDGTLEEESGL